MNSKLKANFTIVIPTLHEAKNIAELIKRIAVIDFGERQFEVILVDDNSCDGTVELVAALSTQYPWLKLIVREGKRDLSKSIWAGFLHARYPILVTMDADLSHPPEKIIEMINALANPDVELAIGSRYVPNGSTDEKWPITRKITSRIATFMAKILLSANIKDPLSGFLAIRKETCFSGDTIVPIGWKIGLEMMVKCGCKNIQEIPIHFSQRYQGSSKLNWKVSFSYLQHFLLLSMYKLNKFIRS